MTSRAPTSVVLDGLLGDDAPDRVTLGWLMGRLGDRSFGIVLLLLALLGLLPGVSALAGVLLAVPAVQMILARPGPVFPRRIAARPFEARRLARVVRRVVPVLRLSHTLDPIEAEGDQRGIAAAARWTAKQRERDGEKALGGIATHVFERRQGGGLGLWLHTFN